MIYLDQVFSYFMKQIEQLAKDSIYSKNTVDECRRM